MPRFARAQAALPPGRSWRLTLPPARCRRRAAPPVAPPADPETLRATLSGLAALVETRDPDARNHLERLRRVCWCICEEWRRDSAGPRPPREWSEMVADAAMLHDVGKAAVPDRVLLKRGTLTPREFACMREHAAAGYRTLRRISRCVGDPPFLRMAAQIAWCHHERWDGRGYPRRLQGSRIPLPARIVAVADVFDAIISRRCYKPPASVQSACAVIRAESGCQFDPRTVAAFERALPRIRAISESAAVA